MLGEVADDLERAGQRLILAHDLGQAGDVLSAEPDVALSVYPTIPEAIAALDGPAKDGSGGG
jgi:hypothetical protein